MHVEGCKNPDDLRCAAKALYLPAFGEIQPAALLGLDDLFAVVSETVPASPGHTLIIARRPATRLRDLTTAEKNRLLLWVESTQEQLMATLNPPPGGFRLVVDDGAAAGQQIPQFHLHVIPRYNTTGP